MCEGNRFVCVFWINTFTYLVESTTFFTATCDVSKVNDLVYTLFNGRKFSEKIKKTGELEMPEEASLKCFNRYFLGQCKPSELCAKEGRLVKTKLQRPILIKVRQSAFKVFGVRGKSFKCFMF